MAGFLFKRFICIVSNINNLLKNHSFADTTQWQPQAANGERMEATYNGLGQMIGETWYDQWGTKLASYKYVYDGAGNITQTLDINGRKLYTYVYEKGVLVTAKEYDATYSNDLVTAKTLVCSVAYHYNDDGQMVQKVMTWNNPEGVPMEYTLSYEYPENGDPVVTFGAGLPDVVFHSKSDSFGRKEFEELQLRKGFSYRQFVYQSGEATQIHKDNAKLKSSPTTGLVKEIVFSDGSTLSYEYDAEERITKVTEVYTLKEPEVTDEGVIFHERQVTDVTEYTYDVLGQLLTETKNGVVINQMTYDNYGNIRSKNGKTYSYGYGAPTWKDLLTQVDGKWIDYDEQGNPIIYMDTHSLYWGKGRELLTFIKCDEDYNEVCRCDYMYNANGIRTSKTVNDIRHDYLLEGTKILRETWQNKTLIPLYDNQDQVCGISYNGNLFSFLKNLQGDVIALVDETGETVARYSYDAWGVPTVLEDHTDIQITNVNPYLYRTYYYDREIGMYYLQSRYYDPTIGRFVNGDDATYLGASGTIIGYNLFAYCENSACNFMDCQGYLSYPAGLFDTYTYNRTAAVNYAQKWYGSRNKQYYSYGQDCANFVSQCVYAGGYPMDDAWYSYRLGQTRSIKGLLHNNFAYNWDVSASWRLVQKQYNYFYDKFRNNSVINISSVSEISKIVRWYNIQKGDVMYFANKRNGRLYHATIIVKVTDRAIYYAAHSNSQKEKNLSSAMSKNDKMYIIRIKNSIQKAKSIYTRR